MEESVGFLAPEQIRSLAEMAEHARAALGRFVGYEVAYDSTALQLLDEWIDRHLRQFPDPPQEVRLLWISFLGEMFRRRHEGEWVVQKSDGRGVLMVLCPGDRGGVHQVDVTGHVNRRISEGMCASLAYAYTITRIELSSQE
jgi:hypothetical protein